MTQRLWLIFAQTATVLLAAFFVISTLKPEWVAQSAPNPQVVELKQAALASAGEAKFAGSYRDAVNRAQPAVVNIFTSKQIKAPRHPLIDDPMFRHFFGDQSRENSQRSSSLGSGVIVSSSGYILTNHHVVEAADEIEVALADGKKMRARTVGSDPETDLAVLQVQGNALPAITLGNDSGLRVGDVVLAIGNPFGVGQTVTMGIVSALGRSHLGINTFENFIQTDAAINPGNSGGALIDSNGDLVGINTAIYSRSGGSLGIGFAIPISGAKQVMEQIISAGSVTRGWIGVEAQEINVELAESFKLRAPEGALIAGVIRGGPADAAGIKPGDILLGVEGKPVRDPSSMLNLIAALVPGKPARMRLLRNQKEVELSVDVGRRPTTARQRRPG
ncbi:MAG: Do family serine endopeptidase [Burkholderiales bacterium]